MELIATVNGKMVFHLDLHSSPLVMEELPPFTWVALVISGEAGDRYCADILAVCKSKKTGYIVCSGRESARDYEYFDMETFDIGEPSQDRFEKPPCVIQKESPAEALWYSLYFATCEDGELRSVVCLDATERGVKSYLKAQAEEMNGDESYLAPEAGEETIEYDSLGH